MPRGIPVRYLHCKKCEGKKFKTISDLRRHQWAQHTETFDNLKNASKTKTLRKQLSVRQFKRAPPLRLAHVNGDMRVSELLGELKGQQKFINDVVALIEHFMSKHQEKQ